MPTSELSDALNPYIVQTRQRIPPRFYDPHLQPVAPPPQEYVPHRSELELAIHPPPPPPLEPRHVTQDHPFPERIQAVHELLRLVANTRDALQVECKRRNAWEQEIENTYIQRHAHMEGAMSELRHELASLKAFVAANLSQGFMHAFPFHGYNMAVEQSQHYHANALPISPVSQPSSFHPSVLTDTAPRHHSDIPQLVSNDSDHNGNIGDQQDVTLIEPPSPAPSPVPPSTSAEHPHHAESSTLRRSSRRKRTPELISSDESSSQDENYRSGSERPRKRTNHHDKRCLTINQAMRLHIFRMMEIDSDTGLPESHTEGVPLESNDAVRFVWDKTIKQSVHNGRMKSRILADLKSHRRLYKHVVDKDFNKKLLEAAFDQAFITLRQKFKAQKDESVALHLKKREDEKATKARRLSRKKLKLASRAEARLNLEVFEHVTFDGALQLECMSSEESDSDEESAGGSHPGFLRIRGQAWRSTRLRKFFNRLDDEEKEEKRQRPKPKRGSGKKERIRGPDKEAFHRPPKGVASWMISRRWMTVTLRKHPDLPDVLKKTVVDPPGFDWDGFRVLGQESDDEESSSIIYP